MEKCKLCDEITGNVFNIDFEAVPICEDCATAIFMQQAQWYSKHLYEHRKNKHRLDKRKKSAPPVFWDVCENISEGTLWICTPPSEDGVINLTSKEPRDNDKVKIAPQDFALLYKIL